MTPWTFSRNYAAHLEGDDSRGIYPNNIVTIPDQVADDQKAFDGQTFPALTIDGDRIMVTLDGDAYGLHTSWTGDPVVRLQD